MGGFSVMHWLVLAVVAILLLGEPFTAVHAAGFLLLTGSLLLATWPTRRRNV